MKQDLWSLKAMLCKFLSSFFGWKHPKRRWRTRSDKYVFRANDLFRHTYVTENTSTCRRNARCVITGTSVWYKKVDLIYWPYTGSTFTMQCSQVWLLYKERVCGSQHRQSKTRYIWTKTFLFQNQVSVFGVFVDYFTFKTESLMTMTFFIPMKDIMSGCALTTIRYTE